MSGLVSGPPAELRAGRGRAGLASSFFYVDITSLENGPFVDIDFDGNRLQFFL